MIKENQVLPVRRYGLKSICKDSRLVNFQWRLPKSGSQLSVVRYYDYLNTENAVQDKGIKDEILMHKEDDVRAIAAVVEWIRGVIKD